MINSEERERIDMLFKEKKRIYLQMKYLETSLEMNLPLFAFNHIAFEIWMNQIPDMTTEKIEEKLKTWPEEKEVAKWHHKVLWKGFYKNIVPSDRRLEQPVIINRKMVGNYRNPRLGFYLVHSLGSLNSSLSLLFCAYKEMGHYGKILKEKDLDSFCEWADHLVDRIAKTVSQYLEN